MFLRYSMMSTLKLDNFKRPKSIFLFKNSLSEVYIVPHPIIVCFFNLSEHFQFQELNFLSLIGPRATKT